ncbi:MAG: alanyl-tRNA editing protein [Aggregatilineales bacterium]
MTEAIYQKDSYVKEFTATVTTVDAEQKGVYLDRTAFYPGGGGQPYDKGTLVAGDKTYFVSRAGKGNIHIIEGDELPEIGTVVTGILDWDRRYKLMRVHTAMHILCGVVWRDYGASVTGGDMDVLKGRMDFEFERLEQDTIAEIEVTINAEMAKDYPLQVKVFPREEAFQIPDLIRTKINLLPEGIPEVRTVEIVGLDLQADGGTHVARTGEVGAIHVVKYKSKGGINKRLYVELDETVG